MMQVSVKKRGEVLRRFGDVMFLKEASCDRGVGASGNFDRLIIFIATKTLLEPQTQGAFAGTAAGEQGAVDIEKNKFSIHGGWSNHGHGACKMSSAALHRTIRPRHERAATPLRAIPGAADHSSATAAFS